MSTIDLLRGALHKVILGVPACGETHRAGVVDRASQLPKNASKSSEGLLYPSRCRMEAEWVPSDNCHSVKYRALTTPDWKQLESEPQPDEPALRDHR